MIVIRVPGVVSSVVGSSRVPGPGFGRITSRSGTSAPVVARVWAKITTMVARVWAKISMGRTPG